MCRGGSRLTRLREEENGARIVNCKRFESWKGSDSEDLEELGLRGMEKGAEPNRGQKGKWRDMPSDGEVVGRV
jgi:hypothetical protein